jgi:hypothetical protein
MHKVIWKGKCIALLTQEEIALRYKQGKLGALHSVELKDGIVVSIDDFIKNPTLTAVRRDKKEFNFKIFGFILVCLCIVHAYFALPVLLYAGFLFKSNRRLLALRIFCGGILYILCGFILYLTGALPWWI